MFYDRFRHFRKIPVMFRKPQIINEFIWGVGRGRHELSKDRKARFCTVLNKNMLFVLPLCIVRAI